MVSIPVLLVPGIDLWWLIGVIQQEIREQHSTTAFCN
jgi:hypothetical protein